MRQLLHSMFVYILGCICVSGYMWYSFPDGNMHIWFLDVGQGDATLLIGPAGSTVLIDGGPDSTVTTELGAALSVLQHRIDIVVLTHPDLDHLAGLIDVIKRYDIRLVLLPRITHESSAYETFLRELQEQHIPLRFATASEDMIVDHAMMLDVLHPFTLHDAARATNSNNAGVVIRATYGLISGLLTGDIETPVETALLEHETPLHAQILKVPHHGSKTSSSIPFLIAVHPSLAVISSGYKNRYGHPHPEIVARYHALGATIYNTAESGTLHLTCTKTQCTKDVPGKTP